MRRAVVVTRSSRRGRRGSARRRLSAGVLALALALAGCTYSSSEPGLFRTEAPVEQWSEPPFLPQPANPDLPVAGAAVWTSSEGLRLTSRFAVHAIRRTGGATVLDWSVTPLSAPGLEQGEKIPSWVDLGLSRAAGGDLNAVLIDPTAGKAYRPLQHRSRREFNRCLCTPLWVAQLDLRIGETRLLQASFPTLPTATRFVDVSLTTLPVFAHVPVSPANQVPAALGPVDLRAEPDEPDPLAPPFHVADPRRRGPTSVQSIQIDAIEAGEHFTSMRWTIRSVTDHPNSGLLPAGPPITAELPPDVEVVSPGAASGPQLSAAGTTVGAQWMTAKVQGRKYLDCLCTNIGLWATALRQAGGRATVTTVYPALPAGTRVAEVVLPGATTLWRLKVSQAADSATQVSPPRKVRVGNWRYLPDRPPAGWSTAEWPTPVPEPDQFADYESLVEELTTLPGR